MKLDQRLRLLRGQAAAPAPTAPSPDLAQRLRRLSPGARPQSKPKGASEQTLADRIGAERLAPGLLCIEERLPLDRHHGHIWLGDLLNELPDLVDEPAGHPGGWLFLDTETSGLAGGTGTWAFACGLMRPAGRKLLLRQYVLTRLDAEPRYLRELTSELQGSHLLISFNGKSFDVPLLATRIRLADQGNCLENQRHLDLLHLTRLAFKSTWPDCRLATAERRLLGFVRQGDLPGAQAPEAWLAWLRRGEIEPLAAVLRHNRLDLLSLAALAKGLRQSLADPVSYGASLPPVARYFLARGETHRAFRLLQANRAALTPAALLELARLERRHGNWTAAHDIWRSLADQGVPAAIEAEAKYLEHRARDLPAALALARRMTPGERRERRCRRLETKLARCSPDRATIR